jgi:hypothetical protein
MMFLLPIRNYPCCAARRLQLATSALLAEKLQLIGIFGFSVSSFARDASIGKHSAEEVKSVCDKSAGNFHKTQRETIVGPIVMVALVPIMSLVAKPVRLASPR